MSTGELFEKEKLWFDTIVAKLIPYEPTPVPSWSRFVRCGQDELYRTCTECGKTTKIRNRCCLKWCPMCGQWLSYLRRRKIEAWSIGIEQPKHVVLTVRNTENFTRKKLRAFKKSLVSLRRSKLFAHVRGGCASLEVTNENRGWHLHAHLLLDVRWIDAGELARVWAKRVGQDFAIVKIKDVRQAEYLQEVSKYVVKGSELASWDAEQIRQFIWTLHRARTFFTFGTMQKQPEKRKEAKPCECGCLKFRIEDELAHVLREARSPKRRDRARPNKRLRDGKWSRAELENRERNRNAGSQTALELRSDLRT